MNDGVILNTSVSNSSITFDINATADYLEIQPTYVYLVNVTTRYTFCSVINHSIVNNNLDSSEFNCNPNDQIRRPSQAEVLEEEFKKIDITQALVIKILVWLILGVIFFSIVFITDMKRRDKKIPFFLFILANLIFALCLIVLGIIIQDLLIGKTIKVTIGITLIIWAVGVLTLMIIAYLTDVMRRNKKIGTFLQVLTFVLSGVAIFIVGWIFNNLLTGQSLQGKIVIGILIGIAVFLVAIGIAMETFKRRNK